MEKQQSVSSETNTSDTNSVKDYDLDKQLEFNEGILHNPRLIYDNIGVKLKILSRRDKILQIKLSTYQKKHENLNMCIIVVSSILGIYETFRAKIDDIVDNEALDVTVNLIPIFLSLKFKSTKENLNVNLSELKLLPDTVIIPNCSVR